MPKISIITPTIRPQGLKMMQECLKEQTFKDFEWLIEIGFENKSDLNLAINKMIKRAQGELLVFYQDFIEIDHNGLQKFWDAYKQKDAFYTAPVNDDWRNRQDNQNKPRTFMDWEIDWGACSKKAMFEIGGFDETLDEYWGFDNVNVGLRATLKGYEIICIDNKAIGHKHEDAPMKKLRNPAYHNYRLDQIRQGLSIDFLRG